MADHYYSVAFGDDANVGGAAGGNAVVVATSTTAGSNIELRVTDATTGIVNNKQVLMAALDKIKNYILKADSPA